MHLDPMRDKGRVMPVAQEPAKIDSLRVWHCKYRTLASLSVFANLQTLVIASLPDEALSVIGSLRHLRYLRIVHLPKVTSLAPLAALEGLEVLSLETLPSWDPSGRRTEVDSLDPIGALPRLKHLSLLGVIPTDKSLRSVERCRSLVSAHLMGYPKQEIQRFYAETKVSDEPAPEPDFGAGS